MLHTIKRSECVDRLASHVFEDFLRLDLWLIANFVGVVEPLKEK